MSEHSFEERIKENKLTKTGRIIAEYCLQHKTELPLLSSAEIAGKLGISDVSILRFVTSIGYKNYSDFKHSIQAEVTSTASGVLESSVSPVVQYVMRREGNPEVPPFDPSSFAKIYADILNMTYQFNSSDIFIQTANQILRHRKRYVFGLRLRSGIAQIAYNLFNTMTEEVYLVPEAETKAFTTAMNFTSNDCLIWFALGRYTETTKRLLKVIKESGIFLIVISEQKTSPVALAADLFIYSFGSTALPLPFYSTFGNCIVIETIALAMLNLDWESSRKRMQNYESFLSTLEVSP